LLEAQSSKHSARKALLVAAPLLFSVTIEFCSQFLIKFARRAGNIDPAGDAALAVFHAFDDARLFAALGAVG